MIELSEKKAAIERELACLKLESKTSPTAPLVLCHIVAGIAAAIRARAIADRIIQHMAPLSDLIGHNHPPHTATVTDARRALGNGDALDIWAAWALVVTECEQLGGTVHESPM